MVPHFAGEWRPQAKRLPPRMGPTCACRLSSRSRLVRISLAEQAPRAGRLSVPARLESVFHTGLFSSSPASLCRRSHSKRRRRGRSFRLQGLYRRFQLDHRPRGFPHAREMRLEPSSGRGLADHDQVPRSRGAPDARPATISSALCPCLPAPARWEKQRLSLAEPYGRCIVRTRG